VNSQLECYLIVINKFSIYYFFTINPYAMKNLFLLFSGLFFNFQSGFTQAPAIETNFTIGGIMGDYIVDFVEVEDGIIALSTTSSTLIGGDKTQVGFGQSDFWITKFDTLGNVIYDKVYGGTSQDYPMRILHNNDGTYYVVGTSQSIISGNKTTDRDFNPDYYDYWVLLLDASGNKIFEKSIGGSYSDFLHDAIKTGEGLLLVGSSNSPKGLDKSEKVIGAGGISNDYWVVEIDNAGNVLWNETLGGGAEDACYAVDLFPNGDILLGGMSLSGKSPDKSEPITTYGDFWILRIDSTGQNIIWDQALMGGSGSECYDVKVAYDGTCYAAGIVSAGVTPDTDEYGAISGENDVWLVKLNEFGNIIWEEKYIGNHYERFGSLTLTSDGGALLSAYSNSNLLMGTDKSETNINDSYDIWLIKIDSVGGIDWQHTIGGPGEEGEDFINNLYFLPTIQRKDGSYLIGASSISPSGFDKIENAIDGSFDLYILKLEKPSCYLDIITDANNFLCPNNGEIELIITSEAYPTSVEWSNGSTDEDIYGLSGGTYTATISNGLCTTERTLTIIDAGKLPKPNASVNLITSCSAALTWDIHEEADGYQVKYQPVGGLMSPISNIGLTDFYLFEGLLPDYEYLLYVRGVCASGEKGNWKSVNVTLINDCNKPANVNVTDITSTSSQINWLNDCGALSYTMRYRPVGLLFWFEVSGISDTFVTIGSLSPETTYECIVSTECISGGFSEFTEIETFTTLPLKLGEFNTTITIAPNPANTFAKIIFDESLSGEIKLLSSLGQTIWSTHISQPIKEYSINVSEIESGIYYLQINQNHGAQIQRIVIAH
jgi:hypothetical protein